MSTKPASVQNRQPGILSMLAKSQSPITLSTCFKGVPFSQPVEIWKVYPEFAEFRLWDFRALLPKDAPIYLHCAEVPKVIKAALIGRDFERSTVALGNFVYLSQEWTIRSQHRVQPQFPTYCSIQRGQVFFSAVLEDVQKNGMSFQVKDRFLEELEIQPGAPVELDLHIHPNYFWRALQGEVLYLVPSGTHCDRMGISIQPDDR